jgi:DNA ligase (NAD+)
MSKKRIKELELIIEKANHDYYNEEPSLTDAEYDSLRDELKQLHPQSEALKIVGSQTSSPLSKVKHKIRMGSLEKINTLKELTDWYSKYIPDGETIGSEKIDGLSVSVLYKDGVFVQGVTRGDGAVGEDITHALLKAQFPKKLKKKISQEIRGEVFITKSDYQKNFSDKKNPRNAASGTLRRLDAERSEHLRVKFYQIELEVNTEEEKMKYIESLGLETPNWFKFKNTSDIQKVWEKYENKTRDSLDYEIDGIVLISNSISNQDEQGIIDDRPRFARAYKFTSQAESTKILEVLNQVGRTGIISPVGKIEPTEVSGALISSVYLYNYKEIQRLGLKLNQKVVIERKGDVIPKITQSLESKGDEIKIPTKCPCCSSKLQISDDLIQLRCVNKNCREQIIQSLLFFLETLDIKSIAQKMVEKLYDSKKVVQVSDFFSLTVEDISSLERSGDKIAAKIIKEISAKKELEPELFLASLGIDGLGNGTAKLLIENFHDINSLFKLTQEELLNVHGIGEITSLEIVNGLADKKETIQKLLKIITLKEKSIGKLTGKSFCFTEVRDKQFETDLKAQGAVISDSVNKTLSFLIVKDVNGASSKIEKAKKNNIEIIQIDEAKKRFSV